MKNENINLEVTPIEDKPRETRLRWLGLCNMQPLVCNSEENRLFRGEKKT